MRADMLNQYQPRMNEFTIMIERINKTVSEHQVPQVKKKKKKNGGTCQCKNSNYKHFLLDLNVQVPV